MYYRKSLAKVVRWIIGLAALGLFYSGEALAVCCKSFTGCSCNSQLSCPLGQTKVSSCTTSGGGLTLNGSVISCIYDQAVGSISAQRGDQATNEPAVWTETGMAVTCNKDGVDPAKFDLSLEYVFKGGCTDDPNSGLGQCKFSDSDNKGKRGGGASTDVSQATCANATGVLKYQAFCGPGVTVKGTLTYNPVASGDVSPPTWVDGPGPTWQLVLGGFQSDRKGNVILSKCASDFPLLGTLAAGEVLFYTEQYAPGTNCTGPRLNASDGKRRMCHDHTFDNPNYDPVTGLGATNPPCAPIASTGETFTGGILASDAAAIEAAVLFDNQWKPNSTLNLGCQNSGNIPTTLLNSENFAASSFTGGTIVAYVKGDAGDVSPTTGATPILDANGVPIGLRITFDECRPDGNGLNQVMCRHSAALSTGVVDLTIEGDKDPGLGFIGDAIGVKLSGTCP